MILKVFAATILLTSATWADGARKAVEAVYSRSERAAGYKFYPTMVAYRAPNYEVFGPDGAKMDLSNEAERYGILFQSALSVALRTRIQSFEQIDPQHCRCQIVQELDISRPQGKKKEALTMTLRTVCLDQWTLGSSGWRIQQRRLREQAYVDARETK